MLNLTVLRSILGMHLFGCKFSLRTDNGDTIPDRKNFDTLLWAIVTVFQVPCSSLSYYSVIINIYGCDIISSGLVGCLVEKIRNVALSSF